MVAIHGEGFSQHSREPIPPPGDIIPYLKEIKVTPSESPIALAGHPFAPVYTNENLVDIARQCGLPANQVDAAHHVLKATGITHRYYTPGFMEGIPLAKTMERTAAIGGQLIRRVMDLKGWDHIDEFIDTSAFLPPEINEMALTSKETLKTHCLFWMGQRIFGRA